MTTKNKITKQDKDLLACFSDTPSNFIFWSFRYFLGRMTIHACCFAQDLAKGWHHLDPRVQSLIKRELEEEFKRDDEARLANEDYKPLGHNFVRAAWQKVRDAYSFDPLKFVAKNCVDPTIDIKDILK